MARLQDCVAGRNGGEEAVVHCILEGWDVAHHSVDVSGVIIQDQLYCFRLLALGFEFRDDLVFGFSLLWEGVTLLVLLHFGGENFHGLELSYDDLQLLGGSVAVGRALLLLDHLGAMLSVEGECGIVGTGEIRGRRGHDRLWSRMRCWERDEGRVERG